MVPVELINCCDERLEVMAHGQASLASLTIRESRVDPFSLSTTATCDYCGQRWVLVFSRVLQSWEVRKFNGE